MGEGPGKHYRAGITLIQVVQKFDSEEKDEAYFVSQRWPDGVTCPSCESPNVSTIASRKPQPFRCRDCRKHFSVKTGTLMHSSNLPLSKWAIAFYLFATNLKSVSSMKLRRDLGIGQKAARYMGHRIPGMWGKIEDKFAGPVEVDETYIGGKESNKHEWKKQKAGRGAVGKAPVAGVMDRPTNQIHTEVVDVTDKATLQNFVIRHTEKSATVYTDEAAAYVGLPRRHEAVKHTAGEYVKNMAHTNGLESHWAMFKRAIVGTLHHISVKHLARYTMESCGRHNVWPRDTDAIMSSLVLGGVGKRMTYQTLIGRMNTRQRRMI